MTKQVGFSVLSEMKFESILDLYNSLVNNNLDDFGPLGGPSVYGIVDKESEVLSEIVGEFIETNYAKEYRDGVKSDISVDETPCEKCGGDKEGFSLNMCEDCFDNEVDNYYDGGRDEDE